MFITEYGIKFTSNNKEYALFEDAVKDIFFEKNNRTSTRKMYVHKNNNFVTTIRLRFNPSLSNVTYSFSERTIQELDMQEKEKFLTVLPNLIKNGNDYFGLIKV